VPTELPSPTIGNGWDEVIAARIWLLTRAECPETGFTNSNTYTIGDIPDVMKRHPAKGGESAPQDITIEKGDTEFKPGPMKIWM